MGNDEIINVIKKYAKGVCENDSTGHDWWHIQRVCHWGRRCLTQS